MRPITLSLLFASSLLGAFSGPFANGVNAPGTTGSSRVITLSASGTSGRVMLVLIVYTNGTSGALTMSAADNATGGSNTYTSLINSSYVNANGGQTGLFCAVENNAGATTVTVSLSSSASGFLDAYAMEFAGAANCTPDATATNGASSGTTASSGAYTTSGSSDLLIGGCGAPSVSAVGNSWTLQSNTDGNGWAYKLNVAAGSQNASFTTTSGGWNCVAGSLQAAAAGSVLKTRKSKLL